MKLQRLDPVLHPPVRLQIAAILSRVSEAEFARLRQICEVADSVLSKHLAVLVEAEYVTLRKAALEGRQRTWVALTPGGSRAFAQHVAALQALVANPEAG
jgi:DNA-binding transcriptional ArsR family regulator